jgi:hypothetical protein
MSEIEDLPPKPEEPPEDAPLAEKWEWMKASADWEALKRRRERREERNENQDTEADSQ